MSDPLRPRDDELERSLRALGEELDYPPPRDVAAAVGARLRHGGRAKWGERIRGWLRGAAGDRQGAPAWQPIVAAAGLIVAVFVGSLLAFPTVREAVADWLGLRGISITILPGNPPPIPTQHRPLQLGTPMTLEQARATVEWPILLPNDPALGPPDEVYVDRSQLAAGVVSLVWSARPGYPAASTTGAGLLITELRARIDERYFQKVIGPGTTIEAVHVGADRGYWISGRPHELVVVDQRGEPVFQQVRLAGDVLMWEVGDLTLRLESALSRDEALRVGSSLR